MYVQCNHTHTQNHTHTHTYTTERKGKGGKREGAGGGEKQGMAAFAKVITFTLLRYHGHCHTLLLPT